MLRALGALRRLLLGAQLEFPLPGMDLNTLPGRAIVPPSSEKTGGPPPGKKSHPQPVEPHQSSAPGTKTSPPRSTGICGEELLSRLRVLGLTGIRRCTLTKNQSTVVSFRADQLRAHHAFVDAPIPVLRAVVDFVNGRGVARRRARQVLVAFDIPRADRPSPVRREAAHPDDAPYARRLAEAHRQLNHDRFQGALGDIVIRVSRRMRSRLGHFSPGHGTTPPEIAIARRHLKRDGWASAVETLAHEMVHQWQHETNQPLAHDRAFRAKARQIGIHTAARRAAGRPS